jgi:hypothetical protein
MRFPLLSRLSLLALFITFATAAAVSTPVAQPPSADKKTPVDKDALKKGDPSDVKKPELDKADGKYAVDAGRTVRIIVKYSGDGLGHAESFSLDGDVIFEEVVPTKKGEKRYLFTAPKAGVYTVAFWNQGADTGVIATIVVGGGGNIGPPPTGKIKTVLLITDFGNPQGQVLANSFKNNPDLIAFMKAKGYKFGGVDRSNKGPDGQPGEFEKYIQESKTKGKYPQYFIIGTDDNTIESELLPDSPATLLDRVKKIGGN